MLIRLDEWGGGMGPGFFFLGYFAMFLSFCGEGGWSFA